jgi:hypothetical protein
MIIKSYDVILYNGEKLHFDVFPHNMKVNLKPREFEDRILNELSVKLDKSNPPCQCKFVFG